jgi:hypothetical protein
MHILKSITLLGLSATLLLATSQQNTKHTKSQKTVIQIGQQSTKLLLKTLGSNMKKKMKAGGPMKALDFCSTEAYTLTEKVNTELPNGVSIKRISTKFRNPINKPETNELKVLESLETLQKEHVALPKHLVQQVSKNVYKYYKPLVIKKQVCLKCHGDITNQKIKQAIAKKYPLDNAQHYKMGDLRGAVVVTIDKSKK